MADEKRREEEKRRSGVKLSFPKLNFIIPKEVDIVLSETVHQSIAVARIVFVVVVAVVVHLLLIVVVVNHSTSQSYRHRRPSRRKKKKKNVALPSLSSVLLPTPI